MMDEDHSTSGMSTIVSAILILALLITVIALARVVYVPEMKKQVEADHMQTALKDFMDHKARLDASAQNGRGAVITSSIELGGGDIPIIDPSKSSGTLTVDPSYGSFNLTAYFLNGSRLNTSGMTNLGSIAYASDNHYWTDQQFHYEDGMVMLTQGTGQVMLAPPNMAMLSHTPMDNYILMVTPIRIDGSMASIGSTGSETLTSTAFAERSFYDSDRIDNVTINVTTDFTPAWSQFFRNLFTGVGLKEGTDFNVTVSGRNVTAYLARPIGNTLRLDIYDSDFITTPGGQIPSSSSSTTMPTPSPAPSPSPTPTLSASFTSNVTIGAMPLTVQFNDTSTGNNLMAWQWNFGDGTPYALARNPVHTFTSYGKYTVTLTVFNAGGSSTKQIVNDITVNDVAPVANFTSNATSGTAPLTVQFTNTSTGNNITAWLWNFGDGGTSALQNPVHTFTNANVSNATYAVTLTVTNDGGSSTKAVTGYVTVAPQKPTASFTSNVTSGSMPLTVQFTDTSTGSNGWQWNFGDGTANITAQNPSHTFANVGVYTVTLTVNNSGGSSTKRIVNYITVRNAAPVANFTSSVTSGSMPLTVQFTNTSIGKNITAWQWNFGDGTPNSTLQNPVHTFSSYGQFTIVLTVTNDGGSSTKQITNYIRANNATPAANFVSNVTIGNLPLCVSFTNTSTGNNITAWQWNFGDGTANATAQNPVHTYSVYGTYTVTLTVTNDGGSSTKQIKNDITVHDPVPAANFTSSVTTGAASLVVQFTNTSIGNNITAWQWNFGDGTANATAQNPSHTFTNTGSTNLTRTVTLTVTNDGGSSTKAVTGYITVVPQVPIVKFSANVTSGNAPLSVTFTETDSGGAIGGRNWSFGDGTANATTQNPSHTFANAGVYTVTFTGYNAGGSSTIQKVNYITVKVAH